MPSQEEYLDQLLQNLTDEVDSSENTSVEDELLTATVEDTTEMTAEEINQLLEASQREDARVTEDAETPDAITDEEILEGLLNESDDEELKEIQSLLQKSDNNETIEDTTQEVAPMTEVPSRAEDRKLQREAKKEAKRAAKEARKAEKEAKKALKAMNKKPGNEAEAAATVENTDIVESMDAGAPDMSAETSLEDDLLRELEAFDLLNDLSAEDNEQGVADSAGADSLAQIVAQSNAKKSKKGLFTRILEFINEEDEEESENENIQISDENQTILKEMDKEKKKGKKAKKPKKGTKSIESNQENGEGGEAGTTEKDTKGKKTKKEKKLKKEEQPQEVSLESGGKKIPLKQIIMVAAVCLSIGLVIIIFVQVIGDYSVKQAGKKAFYEGDYQTCYQNLFGKDLNESEQVMYSKSESILTIRLWIREYELLAGEGQEVRALDSLLQSVYAYPTLYTYATQWNADTEVTQAYTQILTILSEKYHLTEQQAKEIADNPNDIEYTKMVMAIAQGEAFGSWNQTEEPEKNPEVLQDFLPEEAELGDSNFVDNNSGQ